MLRKGTVETSDWVRFWLQTYRELGGQSIDSGNKGCPRAGAYGLWYLGRLVRGGRALQARPLLDVDRDLGKNAAYGLIAADMLDDGESASLSELWPVVRNEYLRQTGKEAARTEQGEVRVVRVLFAEGELRAGC